jgi:hypothetical protein
MDDLPKPGQPGKWETVRRLRCGDLMKLFRHRWGTELPDDDAGREDLFELLLNISQAPAAVGKKMAHAIAIWAPWMSREEADHLVEHVQRLTLCERTPTAKQLGERVRLTNAECEQLKLWRIAPMDISDAELADNRKAKRREQDARRRRTRGVRPREVYLTEMAARPKPWEAQKMSRRAWYRKRHEVNRNMARGEPRTIVDKAAADLVPAEQVEKQKGLQGRGGIERLRQSAEVSQVERCEQRRSPDVAADLVPDGVDYRIAALLKREMAC